MSAIWQLPEDILHSIYSEWLEWKDLSMLDIACVEKNERKEWLTSLSDLRMTQRLEGKGFIFDHNMSIFYKWLKNHKVLFVEEFPLRLTVLKDLVGELRKPFRYDDVFHYSRHITNYCEGELLESLCPILGSLVIQVDESASISDQVKYLLRDFLRHSSNLKGVAARIHARNSCFSLDICFAILNILVDELNENSLIKISLIGIFTDHENHEMIAKLLSKHASSLRVLNLFESRKIDLIVSSLIENQIHLRVLTISLPIVFLNIIPTSHDTLSTTTSSLISYLSSAGDLLEVLEIGDIINRSFDMDMDDLVVQVARCCPKLTRLVIHYSCPCHMENLLCLFEQCLHLQHVSIPRTIETEGKGRSLSINVRGPKDDCTVCLSYALRRRQYRRVTLTLDEDNCNRTVGNLKSLLEPCEIHLEGIASETSLISLLQDLPHVNCVHAYELFYCDYTDATLSAITKHAKCLTELSVNSERTESSSCFSDKVLSELITACQSLKRLSVWIPISGSGFESLVAVSKHSSLNEISLTMDESVSEEMLDGLLLDEKVQWPSSMKEGCIVSYGPSLRYKFNEESLQWIKDE